MPCDGTSFEVFLRTSIDSNAMPAKTFISIQARDVNGTERCTVRELAIPRTAELTRDGRKLCVCKKHNPHLSAAQSIFAFKSMPLGEITSVQLHCFFKDNVNETIEQRLGCNAVWGADELSIEDVCPRPIDL